MTGIDLRLLGGLEARSPDGTPIALGPKKARALLAYLGLHLGKPIAREALSSLIWGDISGGEQARRSLRQALTTLRRELPEDALETQRDAIMLRATSSVDVARFEHEARQGDRSSLERALELYRGELLEGFAARADGFDAWLERERKRLQAVSADAMQRLCELQRSGGDGAAAMVTAMRLVATDPVREAAHRTLMELYAEAGRASEAVRQFNVLRAVLAEKLGAKPDAQTTQLLERIRESSERRDAPPPSVPAALLGAPELRPACVLSLALAKGSFDTSLERDVEVTLARFGGSLMRVGARSALGVFGFPRAHDNDLERGLRAALALLSLEPLAADATIGVASGPLLVEYSGEKPVLRGDVIGRAGELSQADACGVRVAGSVVRALGERVQSQPAGGELDACWVTRYLDAAEAPDRTSLAGRRFELAQLCSALELCAESGRGRTFVVRGEAGIGKTRLVRALCDSARERGFAVHVRSCVDFGDDAQGLPIQGILRELMAEEPRAEASPPALALQDMELSLLLEMVREVSKGSAAQEPGGRRLQLERQRSAACKLLALRSAQRPRLIWIDDIHWAESETLAQVGAWVDAAASHRLLLVLTTRSDEAESGALRGITHGRPVTTLDLAPLTPEEASELIAALEPAAERSAQVVLERAGGNPLFIEQLLRCPEPSRVPAGISSLVQARLDQLAPRERSLLQAASVLGRYFSVPALSHLLELDELPAASLVLPSLIAEHADGYAFVHALLRDAVYHGLPEERRIRLHASAARYYAGRDAALHAEHLACAGDAGAAAAYLRAATTERRGGNAERALALCLRARELAQHIQDRHDSALLLGELLIELGRSEAALEAFAAALGIATDSAGRARAHVGRASALRVLDRTKEALLDLAAAERLLDPSRDSALLSRVHYLRGNVLFPLGNWAACLESQTLALEAARRTGSALAEAQALSGMADAHFLAGRWRTARACFERCEQLARQLGSLDLELTSHGMRCNLDIYELSFRSAAVGCQELAERSRSSGSLRAEAIARLCAAWSFLALGDWQPACAEAERGTAVAEGIGARRFSALGLAYTAMARARLGEHQTGPNELARALAHAQASGMTFAGAAVYAALLATAEDQRLPSLLAEADTVVNAGCMNIAMMVFVLQAIQAALKLDDTARAARYADLLETSMSEEPHPLGALLVDFARTLCAWRQSPSSEHNQREVARLRDDLERASLRPAVAFVEEMVRGRSAPR